MHKPGNRLTNLDTCAATWLAALVIVLISGCAPNKLRPEVASDAAFGQSTNGLANDAGNCKTLIALPASPTADRLSADRIRLMSWNVQKESGRGWLGDFERLASNQDLVLLQEAAADSYALNNQNGARYWSFARGYQSSTAMTGVMTLSSSKSLAQCHLREQEPWLRSDKATDITEYALTNTEQTLAVVNIHAINFTLGLAAFNEQLAQIANAIEDHEGPVILSGDLNTWRGGRQKLVDALATDLDLVSLTFNDDRRTTFFGKHVDHIYVRGLKVLDARTPVVESSDHNPIIVTLSLI